MSLYKTTLALTKLEMEALNEFVTKSVKQVDQEEKQTLYMALRQVAAGLENTNKYYFGNDKVSLYKNNT